MERLIAKGTYNKQYYLPAINIDRVANKLGKLEDIEQELGIPLEVLFKALKEGFYVRNEEDKQIRFFTCSLEYNHWDCNWYLDCDCQEDIDGDFLKSVEYEDLKDYGKTWSLTREELENA